MRSVKQSIAYAALEAFIDSRMGVIDDGVRDEIYAEAGEDDEKMAAMVSKYITDTVVALIEMGVAKDDERLAELIMVADKEDK